MPNASGKLPDYVQRNFRLKAFSLVTMQLFVVFSIMLLLKIFKVELVPHSYWKIFLLSVVALNVALLVLLGKQGNVYPVNYILLVAITMLSGITGSFGGEATGQSRNCQVVGERRHLEIVGIMCVAMLVTTFVSAAPALVSLLDPLESVLISMFSGWVVGSAANALLLTLAFGAQPLDMLVPAILTAGLLTAFVLQTAKPLATCNPDSFMLLVAAMNSTLLLIVAVPLVAAIAFCILTSCCLQMRKEQVVEPRQELPGLP